MSIKRIACNYVELTSLVFKLVVITSLDQERQKFIWMPLIPPLLDVDDAICGLSTLFLFLILRLIRWTKRIFAKVDFEPRISLSFSNCFIHYITEATVFQRALNCAYLMYYWFCLIHLIYLIRWKCLHFERTQLQCCTYPSPTWWSRSSPSLDVPLSNLMVSFVSLSLHPYWSHSSLHLDQGSSEVKEANR